MAFFSKLFGSSRNRELDRLLSDAKKQVDREYGPMGKVGSAVIRAATNCRDAVKNEIEADTEKKRKELEIFIFYEFIYFFMHMAMRASAVQLTDSQILKLQSYLGPLVSAVAIDSYCAHWPDDIKKNMNREFYEKLNQAEIEYAECTRSNTGDKTEEAAKQRLQALFWMLGTNVSQLARNDSKDIAIVSLVCQTAIDQWSRMELSTLIADIKEGN
jgi:hypothetical protein